MKKVLLCIFQLRCNHKKFQYTVLKILKSAKPKIICCESNKTLFSALFCFDFTILWNTIFNDVIVVAGEKSQKTYYTLYFLLKIKSNFGAF